MKRNNNIGTILDETGCKFRSIIESHLNKFTKNRDLQDMPNVEWLLEPLTEINHPNDLILGAFRSGDQDGYSYHLYFHKITAFSFYIPFSQTEERPRRTPKVKNPVICFDDKPRVLPDPNPYDKSLLVRGILGRATSAIPSIWDDLTIPFTEAGIWQALLLHDAPILLPLWWHCNYIKRIYVFSQTDMQSIYDENIEFSYHDDEILLFEKYEKTIEHEYGKKFEIYNLKDLASYLNRDDILPAVEINGNKATVTFHYWNDWRGFCKAIIPVEKHGTSVKFGEEQHQVLVKYKCRIMF